MILQKPTLEHQKFAKERTAYQETLTSLLSLELQPQDYIHHFPAVVGELTLARYLSLYEAYKMTFNLAGHVAEVGIGLGAVTILFAKLCRLFEPHSLTLVHGFDWFQGARPTEEERFISEGHCRTSESLVRELVSIQGLDGIIRIHNLDVGTELAPFFQVNGHLMFKLVFLDCGVHSVVSSAIRELWPRIVPGGLLVFDHFSHELAPGEARAIRELLPDAKFLQFPFGWMPTAYTIKE